MSEHQFVGTWKLVSMEFVSSDGRRTFPFGRQAYGILIYDANGNMAVQTLSAGIARFESNDMLGGTAEEIRQAYHGNVSYFGVYEIDAQDHVVTHVVEGSSFPNWIGTRQRRYYSFSEGCLTLKTPRISIAGEEVVGSLRWTPA